MELKLFLFFLLIILSLQDSRARRGGGGSRSSGGGRSSGSSYSGGSRSSGSSYSGGSRSSYSSGSSSYGGGSRSSSYGGGSGSSSYGGSRSWPTFNFGSKPSGSSSSSNSNTRGSGSGSGRGGSTFENSFSDKRFNPSKPKVDPPKPYDNPHEYRTPPSAPKPDQHKKVHFSETSYKPSAPPAPPLGGSFGGYYHGTHGGGIRPPATTPKPYAPPSILKPKVFSPPYPAGQPLHPMPQNIGSSSGSQITSSKYPQVSSGSSPYNPYYFNSGNSYPKPGGYPQTSGPLSSGGNHYPGSYPHPGTSPGSYPHSGANPGSYSHPGTYPGSYSHSGTNPGSYPHPGTNTGFYGNQGHYPHAQSAPYPPQGSFSSANSGYHPNYATGGTSISQPGVVYVPSVVSSSRGTGDIFKEALIHSTVDASVRAATNRLFYPSHFSGSNYGYGSGYGSPSGSSTGTHIVHNNYYYGSSSTDPQGTGTNQFGISNNSNNPSNPSNPNSPNSLDNPNNPNYSNGPSNSNNPNYSTGPNYSNNPNYSNGTNNSNNPNYSNDPNNSNGLNNNIETQFSNSSGPYNNFIDNGSGNSNIPSSYQQQLKILDEELRNLTEKLFSRQEFDVNKYIRLNLQMKVNSTNITDESIEPLFEVQPEAYQIPSIELINFLYDNYKFDSQEKEKITPENIKEQNNFLEVILQTNVMSGLMKWLTDKNVIASDMLSQKEILTRIWFTPIEGSTSAFERTFMAENYWNTSIMGLQNWIYVSHMESKKEVNYLGYMENLDLGSRGSLLKAVIKANEVIQPTTIFVGTLPELEMALYTVCFFVRPNELCSISLGGAKFNIFTHTFQTWGKDLLDVAVPVL